MIFLPSWRRPGFGMKTRQRSSSFFSAHSSFSFSWPGTCTRIFLFFAKTKIEQAFQILSSPCPWFADRRPSRFFPHESLKLQTDRLKSTFTPLLLLFSCQNRNEGFIPPDPPSPLMKTHNSVMTFPPPLSFLSVEGTCRQIRFLRSLFLAVRRRQMRDLIPAPPPMRTP